MVEISQNFVAFSEYMNFTITSHLSMNSKNIEYWRDIHWGLNIPIKNKGKILKQKLQMQPSFW